jgi:diguanylate cyclase (GGDEF)-like protein
MGQGFARLRGWLTASLTRKFIVLLLGFLLLQGLQLGVGIYLVLRMGEEVAFLNEAGRQRMQSLLLWRAAEEAAGRGRWEADSRGEYLARLAEQERVLARFAEVVFSHLRTPPPGLVQAQRHWQETLRPLLLSLADRPQSTTLLALQREIPRHIENLDALVTLAERNLRARLVQLAIFQGAVLALGLLLGLIGLAMARYIVTLPARRLIASARAIAAGRYDERLPVASRDELGELARTFNAMADAIAEKTAGIEALNEAAVKLSAATGLEELKALILEGALRLSHVHGVGLVIGEPPAFAEWLQRGLDEVEAAACRRLAETACLEGRRVEETADGHVHTCLPLRSRSGRRHGALCFRLHAARVAGTGRALYETFAALAAEVLENARQYVEAVDEALTDSLTGLANRRALDARLELELERSRRSGQPLSVLMVDIDHFKHINDRHGHAAGDAVLRRLAGILREEIRGIDLAARYGGEEFVLLLPATASAAAYAVAERIRQAVAREVFVVPDERTLRVQVSIGIACFPDDDPEGDHLLQRADEALYAAKGAGRNRVMAYRDLED